jgi:hypothetical protein
VKIVKRPKPVGVCTVCAALTNELQFINQRCSAILHGRRCSGQYRSELTHVWGECEECHAVGRVGTQECPSCKGFGWFLVA